MQKALAAKAIRSKAWKGFLFPIWVLLNCPVLLWVLSMLYDPFKDLAVTPRPSRSSGKKWLPILPAVAPEDTAESLVETWDSCSTD